MTEFTINFFAPISIDRILNTPLFYVKEYTLSIIPIGNGTVTKEPDRHTYLYGDEVKLTASPVSGGSFSAWSGDYTSSDNPTKQKITIIIDKNTSVTACFTPSEKDRVSTEPEEPADIKTEAIEDYDKRAGILEVRKFIDEFNKDTKLNWEIWNVNDDLQLIYPWRIECPEPVIFSTLKMKDLLSSAEYSPFTLVDEEVRIFLHSYAVAIVNYTFKFQAELVIPKKRDEAEIYITEKVKKIQGVYEKIVDKFREPIPGLSEHAKDVKDTVTNYIDQKKIWAIDQKKIWAFKIDVGYAISDLFPWQYVVYHMDRKLNLTDQQKAILLCDDEKIEDYSKDEDSRNIYIAWRAAVIRTQEPHQILAYDYLAEISCCLWRELQLVEKLLITENKRLLLQARKRPTPSHLETIRNIRVVAETILSKVRSFEMHFQIEYIGIVQAIYKKWLITDNLMAAIKRRVETIDMIYGNAKDALNDRLQKYLGYITLTFTILSFIAVITAIVTFWDYESHFELYIRQIILGISLAFVAIIGIGIWRWLRR